MQWLQCLLVCRKDKQTLRTWNEYVSGRDWQEREESSFPLSSLPHPSRTHRAAGEFCPSLPAKPLMFPGLSHTQQFLVSPKVLVPPLLFCLPVSLHQEYPYLIFALKMYISLSSKSSSALHISPVPFSPSHPVKLPLPLRCFRCGRGSLNRWHRDKARCRARN